MLLQDGIDAVLAIFDGLPADLVMVITVSAVVGAAALFYSKIKRASR